MRHAQTTRGAAPRAQRGFAMIAIVTLVALMSAYLIANALQRTQADLATDREERTQRVLKEAKRALIAWASSEAVQRPTAGDNFQPGALPCPDTNNDGNAEGTCSTIGTRLGRLPWKTLGIDDLRDASGERLWYAVSANFRKATTTTIINSDTLGTLTLTGAAPASNLAAVVIAPGPSLQLDPNLLGALQNQVRDPASPASINDAGNYLEGENAGTNNDIFTVSALNSYVFNDRVLALTRGDLLEALEPAVAAKMRANGLFGGGSTYKSIRDFINDYASDWGRYPFAATFDNPNASSYKGVLNQESGLLPLTTDATFITWRTPATVPAATVTVTNVGGIGTVNLPANCAPSTTTRLECQFTYVNIAGDASGPILDLAATVSNAGLAFLSKNSSLELTVDRFVLGAWIGDSLQPKSSGCNAMVSPLSSESSCLQSTNSLLADAGGNVTLRVQLRKRTSSFINCPTWCTMRLRLTTPPFSELAAPGSSSSEAYWFIHNEWYKHVQYAVSPGHLPGGSGTCTASTPGAADGCLMLTGVFGSGTVGNAKALLVLAGRSISTQTRPSASLVDYFEARTRAPETASTKPAWACPARSTTGPCCSPRDARKPGERLHARGTRGRAGHTGAAPRRRPDPHLHTNGTAPHRRHAKGDGSGQRSRGGLCTRQRAAALPRRRYRRVGHHGRGNGTVRHGEQPLLRGRGRGAVGYAVRSGNGRVGPPA